MQHKVLAFDPGYERLGVAVVEKEKGKDIVQYIDREIVKKEEIVKYIEQCPVPKEIIDLHNQATELNKAAEVKK